MVDVICGWCQRRLSPADPAAHRIAEDSHDAGYNAPDAPGIIFSLGTQDATRIFEAPAEAQQLASAVQPRELPSFAPHFGAPRRLFFVSPLESPLKQRGVQPALILAARFSSARGGTIQSLAGYRLGRSAPPPYTRAWCDPDSALREIRSLSHCCHAPPPQVFPACTCLTPDTRIDTYPQREEPAAFVTFFRLQNTQNTGLAAKHPMDC